MKRKVRRMLAILLAMTNICVSIPTTVYAARTEDEVSDLNADDGGAYDGIVSEEEIDGQGVETLAWYPLLGNTEDASGNGFDGTAVGITYNSQGAVLPGGSTTSAGNNYIKFPGEMLKDHESITISSWIKSNTDAGNYSALYIGSDADSTNKKMPTGYWLFNPANPSGNFKSVFTNSYNASAPYNAEVGVSGISTKEYKGVWTHYTTVITENSITGYINGAKIGTTTKSRLFSDFADELFVYAGRSNYLDDRTYAGTFQDIRFYGMELSDSQVKNVYSEAITKETQRIVLESAVKELDLGDLKDLTGDINLPLAGPYHTTITWSSSNTDVIDNNGKLTLSDESQTVKLTATLSLGEETKTAEFTATVVAKDMIGDILFEKLQVPYVLTMDDKLSLSLDGYAVTWDSSDTELISNDGFISGESADMADVHLEARIEELGIRKTFDVKVLSGKPTYILGYTRTASDIELDRSLHLAYSEDGTSYKALYYNTGILFAKAVIPQNKKGTTKLLLNPYMFRMADGSFGVVAERVESDGSQAADDLGRLLLFTSSDLVFYEEVGLIDMNTTKAVKAPICEYDASAKNYLISWLDAGGTSYNSRIDDILQLEAEPFAEGRRLKKNTVSTSISGANSGNIIAVSADDGEYVKKKLSAIVNTGVTLSKESVTIQPGADLDLSDITVTADYSDGTSKVKGVDFDISKVNKNLPGTYQVTGTIKQDGFAFPLMRTRPDPNIYYYNGKYYFISTNDSGQTTIYIRESDTIKGLATATEHLILQPTSKMKDCLWAPELHEVNGKLYIFFSASQVGGWNNVQSHVTWLKDGGNPTKAADWAEPVKVQKKDGTILYDNSLGITLDMTYFKEDGEHYVIWAQRPIDRTGGTNGGSDLWIATIDGDAPWKLTSDPVRICQPEYGWDRNTDPISEGPFVIRNNEGTLFVTFSGSGVNTTYCVGIMTAKSNNKEDLLNPENWVKTNYPILTAESVSGQYGPGHNSYIQIENGDYLNVFHAMDTTTSTRHAGIRRVHWDMDNTPVLDMTDDREIIAANKTVTLTVKVEDTDLNTRLQLVLDSIDIPNKENIRGNISLPTQKDGVDLVWRSSNTKIIDTASKPNADYFDTPAGVVTRQSQDAAVQMTVTASLNGQSVTKEIEVIVKAEPQEKEYAAYLYAHFNELKGQVGEQDIFFGVSEDGLNWSPLNENKAILTSSLGDLKVRDPYIFRSAEDDKFYLLATDLDIYASKYGDSWPRMATEGSTALIIWESTDLVNWSNERRIDVAGEWEAGNAWAPAAVYDKLTGEYLVFWSSVVKADSYAKHRILVSKTRDFYTFTTPEIYSDNLTGNIDADIYYDQKTNMYYRLIKDDTYGYVTLQSASQLLAADSEAEQIKIGSRTVFNRGSQFTRIANDAANCLETFKGAYEGATTFKFNDRDEWCVLVDEYGGSTRGYIPFITTDLSKANSVVAKTDGTYLMPVGAKHGSVIPLTQEEYDALLSKWGVQKQKPSEEEQKEPILTYDFEETFSYAVIKDKSGMGDGKAYGNASYVADAEKGSQVLYLDGVSGTYVELPQGFFDARDKMTLSMDIKVLSTANYHFDFTVGQDTNKYSFLRIRDTQIRNAITANQNADEREVVYAGSGFLNKWINVKVVMDGHSMYLYVDNVLISTNHHVRSISDLGANLKSYFGKSFYAADSYMKGYIDNVQIYNRALTEEEILGSGGQGGQNNENLILYYDFSQTDGTLVEDQSGKEHNGTIKGSGASIQDDALILPGGASGSNAAFVELPMGMFDGQDTLTLSIWLKNQTGKGNYSAMYFGSNNASTYPAQYWLLNPCNPSGYMKSVITNGLSAGSPWSTESGISPTTASRGILGPVTNSEWALYTTIIEKDKITAYYNGDIVGTVATSRTVSQFGQNMAAYIGKSSYADIFYKGMVKDVKVYTSALTAKEVSDEYKEGLLKFDKQALVLDTDKALDDITLPTKGTNGSTITWTSSKPQYINGVGNVTRPEKGQGDAAVLLTAILELGGNTLKKEFTILVLENDPVKDMEIFSSQISLNAYFVTADLTLPAMAGKAAIVWSSDNTAVTREGKVTRPEEGEGSIEVTLTASLSYNGTAKDFIYKVIVLEKGGSLLTYVTKGNTDRTDALYVAYLDNSSYHVLNSGKAILYPKGGTKMGSPSLFRKADGSYGLIASVDNNSSSVLLYDSKDLLQYTNERQVELNSQGLKVTDPKVIYDIGSKTYKVYWVSSGKNYVAETVDFLTFTVAKETTAYDAKRTAISGIPSDALASEADKFEITASELEQILKKYGEIVNTGIQHLPDISIEKGSTLPNLPDRVTAEYNDGSTKKMAVQWALNNVDINVPGTYTVTGTVMQEEYSNPLIKYRADPCVVYDEINDCYYFTASYPTWRNGDTEGYDRIVLRTAKTIEGLANAEEVTIWHQKDSPSTSRYIWAPEIVNIKGTWYVLFTGSTSSSSVWSLVPHLLECKGTADGGVMNPANWSDAKRITKVAGDQAYQGLSIDMTYFEVEGQGYYIWSEKPSAAQLVIAPVDKEDPTKLIGKGMVLTSPTYAWEWNLSENQYVDEGPAVIKNNGKIYVCYSAATVDYNYCVGVLSIDETADIMNINNWTKNPYPLLTTSDFNSEQLGPGHNSFTIDAYGNAVIVYHARTPGEKEGQGDGGLNDPGRHARVKNVNFGADGMPILNMTREEELSPSFKEITITVTVTDGSIPIKELENMELAELIEKALEELNKTGIYTYGSLEDLQDAVDGALVVVNSENSYLIEEARQELITAIRGLKLLPTDSSSLEALKELVIKARLLADTEGSHTQTSRQNLSDLLDEIESYLEDDLEEDFIAYVTKAINDLIDALVAEPGIIGEGALIELINAAGELSGADYTAKSWEYLQTILDIAKDVYDSSTNDEYLVEETVAALQEAINDLVDLRALKEAISRETGLTASDYTLTSWYTALIVLYDAKAVLAKSDASATEVTAAANALNAAYNSLVVKVNKDKLKLAINAAISCDTTSYTTLSVLKMKLALNDAQKVYNGAGYSQAEVNNAEAALNNAVSALVLQVNKTKLKDLIASTSAIPSNSYTFVSWYNLRLAISEAKTVANDTNATQAQVDAQVLLLKAAEAALVSK